MTDLEKFEDMLNRAEIQYNTFNGGNEGKNKTIAISGGYIGFYSRICFKEDGSLHTIQAFED